MHNNTLIFTHNVVFKSKTWSGFSEISLETLPSCIELWNFGLFFQNFGKYQAKSSFDGKIWGILAKFH